MKKVFGLIILLITLSANGQEGLKIGFEVTPGARLNHQITATTAHTLSFGYGFSAGVPVKVGLSNTGSLNTGLLYEFIGFDIVNAGFLNYSLRQNQLQIPLMFNRNLSGNWYATFGGGLNINMLGTELTGGLRINRTPLMKTLAPWIGLGANALIERGRAKFEVGLTARYKFLDVWNSTGQLTQAAKSRIVAIELTLRTYLFDFGDKDEFIKEE